MGAFAELLTIGAVLPFLAIAAGGDFGSRMPAVHSALSWIGIRPGDGMFASIAMLLVGAAIVSAGIRLALTWSTQKFVFGLQHDLTVRIFGRLIRQPGPLQLSMTACSCPRIFRGTIRPGLAPTAGWTCVAPRVAEPACARAARTIQAPARPETERPGSRLPRSRAAGVSPAVPD